LVSLQLRADVVIRYFITDEMVNEQKERSGTGWFYRPIQTVFNQYKDYVSCWE